MSVDDFDDLDSFFNLSDISEEESGKSTRVNLKDFLAAYINAVRNGGNSISLAMSLGISPQAVRQRTSKLIAKGVSLPKLGNTCRKIRNMC